MSTPRLALATACVLALACGFVWFVIATANAT